jgi:hypothetical protein
MGLFASDTLLKNVFPKLDGSLQPAGVKQDHPWHHKALGMAKWRRTSQGLGPTRAITFSSVFLYLERGCSDLTFVMSENVMSSNEGIILVLGVTGAGKSSFVDQLKENCVVVGHSLHSGMHRSSPSTLASTGQN